MTAPDTPHPRLPLTLAACCPPTPTHNPSPPLPLSAGEGSSTEAAEQAIVTIGDKGRAQLQRVAPDQIRLSVADTYKDRVTFSQVGVGCARVCWLGGGREGGREGGRGPAGRVRHVRLRRC